MAGVWDRLNWRTLKRKKKRNRRIYNSWRRKKSGQRRSLLVVCRKNVMLGVSICLAAGTWFLLWSMRPPPRIMGVYSRPGFWYPVKLIFFYLLLVLRRWVSDVGYPCFLTSLTISCYVLFCASTCPLISTFTLPLTLLPTQRKITTYVTKLLRKNLVLLFCLYCITENAF